MALRLVLIRHGETAWTLSGQHTGRTDIPLTEHGRAVALELADRLNGWTFVRALSSPLSRARETARLAGYGTDCGTDLDTTDDLLEWDYGDYDGRTTEDIRTTNPRWSLWVDGVPGGESADEVGSRVDRVIEALSDTGGDVVLFAHGHLLRVLTARWLGLPPADGRLFLLDPGTISVLGYERETPVILRWNS